MKRGLLAFALGLGLWFGAVPARAADDFAAERALAEQIDRALAEPWKAAGVRPAPLADDSEFARRVTFDLLGRIPTVSEVRAFLADRSPDKRLRLVRELQKRPAAVDHQTNVWRDLLLPEAATNFEVQAQAPAFNAWLRQRVADNVGYDRIVRALLTVPFASPRVKGSAVAQPRGNAEPSPMAFYLAKDVKPENLASATSRLFLGVKIECAQCHDHPSGHWTREQFWEYAAFFAGLQRGSPDAGGGIREVFDRRELTIPGGGQVAEARFLDDTDPRWRFNVGARVTLAEWVTSPKNPFFAKAAVNRVWAQLFGVGLVEPVDDLGPHNKPSHPALLDDLAKAFVARKFDVRFLTRAVMATQAYQRTSTRTHPSQDDPRRFARRAVKGLTPEQLFESLATATGYREPLAEALRPILPSPVDRLRGAFQVRFVGNAARIEPETSILQALALMNGPLVSSLTDPGKSYRLATLANDRKRDTAARLEVLYLATLSRLPRADERERLVRYIERGGEDGDPKRALGDVLWVLLNHPEFGVNH